MNDIYRQGHLTIVNRVKRLFTDKKYSLKSKMIFIYIFASILPVFLLSIISFNYYSSNLESKVNDLIEYNLIHTKEKIETSVDLYKHISYRIVSDSEVIRLIKNLNEGTELEEVVASGQLKNKFAGYSFLNSDIRSIAFINKNYEAVFYDRKLDTLSGSIWSDENFNKNVYHQTVNSSSDVMLIPSAMKLKQLHANAYLLNIAIPIKDLISKEINGVIVISIDEKVIDKMCNPDRNKDKELINTYSFIVNEYGEIVSFVDKNLIGTNIDDYAGRANNKSIYEKFIGESAILENKTAIINELLLDKVGWTIVNVVDKNDVFYDLYFFKAISIGLGIIVIVFSLIVILLYTNKLTESVQKIINAMNMVQKGDLSTQVELDSKDEIAVIGDNFNKMVITISELLNKVRKQGRYINEVTRKHKEAEIKALQAQINPHFIYNTLDCINWMAIDKKEYEISNMLKNLAQILRYTISNINTTVKVREEIEWLRQYIYLQQVRFDNCFQCEIDVDSRAYDYYIYKLLLQPFIENAIIHGFDGCKDGGKLFIKVNFIGSDYLVFHIEDNGKGIDKQKLDIIQRRINSNYDVIEDSIGISNAYNRMRMYYDDRGKLEIFSEENRGTIILLYIPINQLNMDII